VTYKLQIFVLIILCQSSFNLFAAPRVCDPVEVQAMDVDGPESQLKGDLGPYLQSVRSYSALIEWNNLVPSWGVLSIHAKEVKAEPLKIEINEKRTHHVIGLCDLEPRKTYTYQVNEGPQYSFRTLPHEGSEHLRFVAMGDVKPRNLGTRGCVDHVRKFDPDLVVLAGDIGYEWGSYKNFIHNFLNPLKNSLATRAFYPTLGNHDARTSNGKPYLDIFSLPHNNPKKLERYYSFDAGPVHFVMLDSTSRTGLNRKSSDQIKWVKNDLAKTKQPWKVAVFHHPPYGIGKHGSSKKIRKVTEPIFAHYGLDLVINGHNHTYERTKPQKGVTYITAGGGGGVFHRLRKKKDFVEIAVSHRYHFVAFEVSETKLEGRAIDHEGEVFDEWAIEKEREASIRPGPKTRNLPTFLP